MAILYELAMGKDCIKHCVLSKLEILGIDIWALKAVGGDGEQVDNEVVGLEGIERSIGRADAPPFT